MKIAIDCHTLKIKHWAGKEKVLHAILNEFKQIKGTDEFFLYFRDSVYPEETFPANFRLISFDLPTPFWHLRVLFDVYLKKINILFSPCAYLLSFLNLWIPNLVLIHDTTSLKEETKKFHTFSLIMKERLLVKIVINKARKIITSSENSKNDIIELLKVKAEKIEVVPLAADGIYKLADNKEELKEILEKYRLPEKYILNVGTIEPRKNILNLIKGYGRLYHEKKIAAKLVIVGKKGWLYDTIFTAATDLKIADQVVFAGYVPDEIMPFLYSGADCLVYPSFYEGFGLPVIEAMACGCPVITSNTSSLPEVAGDAAILVDPHSDTEIADAIYKILNDDNLRNNLIEKGLKRSKKFSWQITAERILSLMNNLN
jgi:glycosyltransferase involved in cell wall biosynthesis